LSELRGMRVFVADHPVGHVTDLILDPVENTVLGFEVEATSGRLYFLPLALTAIPNGHVAVTSPLHMVDDVDYYRRHARRPRWPAAASMHLELVSGAILEGFEE
jgi:PRC-barrel domain